MLMKPRHDFRSLRMKDELATLQTYGSPLVDASALHDLLDVIKRQVFYWFLPDIAMLAA